MKVRFLGAAQTVTGSCYILEVEGRRVAVDCGMHQGNREIDARNLNDSEYGAARLDCVLLTHAHIDHSGLLPRLVKRGFSGPVYATLPTQELLEIMLLDSAHIQEMEAEWQNRKARRKGKKPVEPLYTQEDALQAASLFAPVEYGKSFEPVPGLTVTYYDAGHILGSAFIEVTATEDGKTTKLTFSGDLGRPDQLFLRDPSQGHPTDYLFLESTYGNRDHKDESTSRGELAQAVLYSYEHGEKVIIPAFAVERTQEMIYTLYLLHREGKLPEDMPVYVDSPMAIRATEVFKNHPEFFDAETTALLAKGENPLELPNLRFTLRTEESMEINSTPGPAIVISASGMCNAGRIKHHLRHNLWKSGASVVFVGFQARGTPGRKLVDGAQSLRIFGEDVQVNAKIYTIGGFSAHAGQSQILQWLENFSRPEMKIFLVHGEHSAQKTLADVIRDKFGLRVYIPEYLEECVLEAGDVVNMTGPDPDRVRPRIDWPYLVGESEQRLEELKSRLAELESKNWVDQADLRDRLLEVNAELTRLISEM